jgi:hypothetical protein
MDYKREMRFPRNIKATSRETKSWFYIEPSSLHIFVQTINGLGSVRLTRRQISAALAIMDVAKNVKEIDKKKRNKK